VETCEEDAMTETSEATFIANRPLLVGVAYRLLGSIGDAEDVVQEAWLRWARVDADTVADPTAFLVRMVSRIAIDRMRRVAARRESYVGPWLPEPVLTEPGPEGEAERAASCQVQGTAATHPRRGQDRSLLRAVSGEALPPGSSVEIVEVNGGPAAVLVAPTGPVAMLQLDLDGEHRVTDIRLVGNPDKLGGLAPLAAER
jgi:DNA-directed RNA polymerase specialized sigma24 family protein